MNIVDLESFVAVVDCGSIVAAAARLHLTQSAITRRVQNLEEALGVSLFDRQTRPLQLTKEGKATYENARPVLMTVGELKAAVVYDGEPSGDFSFGIARGLGDGALIASIEGLRLKFPLLKLQAFSQWTKPLIDRVSSKSLEAAVVLLTEGDVPPGNVDCECLGQQPYLVVGPRSGGRNVSTTLEELSTQSWILSPEGCGIRYTVKSALMHQRLPFRVAVEAEGKELQLSLVARGIGLGVVPRQVYQESSFREELSVLRVADFAPQQDMWLIYAKQAGNFRSEGRTDWIPIL